MPVRAANPAALAEEAPPPWVVSWKEMRAEKAREKQDRGPSPVDLAARAKREAVRAAKVAPGTEDLSLWIDALVRQGFASLSARLGNLWDEQARRMVDIQAPGVARKLRQIDGMALAGDDWQAALLDRLARLHLLAEGYRPLASLPADVAEGVSSTIGFPVDLDGICGGPGVRDRWQVIGQAIVNEDRLQVART